MQQVKTRSNLDPIFCSLNLRHLPAKMKFLSKVILQLIITNYILSDKNLKKSYCEKTIETSSNTLPWALTLLGINFDELIILKVNCD
jgi:hypothetical protein